MKDIAPHCEAVPPPWKSPLIIAGSHIAVSAQVGTRSYTSTPDKDMSDQKIAQAFFRFLL